MATFPDADALLAKSADRRLEGLPRSGANRLIDPARAVAG
jgi:hypothetical protein